MAIGICVHEFSLLNVGNPEGISTECIFRATERTDALVWSLMAGMGMSVSMSMSISVRGVCRIFDLVGYVAYESHIFVRNLYSVDSEVR